jgi:hypothetical protein
MPPNHELNIEEAVPPKVYTDMEVELKVFNETVRPDYQVMRSCSGAHIDGVRDLPLYIIEVKRTEDQDRKAFNVISDLEQHFKQLRYVCIDYSLPYCNGILTDYKDWYFTRCNFSREIQNPNGQIFEVS